MVITYDAVKEIEYAKFENVVSTKYAAKIKNLEAQLSISDTNGQHYAWEIFEIPMLTISSAELTKKEVDVITNVFKRAGWNTETERCPISTFKDGWKIIITDPIK